MTAVAINTSVLLAIFKSEAEGIQFSELEEEAALLAGTVFRKYRQAGGPRTTIVPDFLVAAHAAKQADAWPHAIVAICGLTSRSSGSFR